MNGDTSGEFEVLYADLDAEWLYDQQLHEEAAAIAPELDIEEIDPDYWQLDPDAWAVMTDVQKQMQVATCIVQDGWALRWAGIEPEEWVDMPLEEREEVIRAERDSRV